MKLFKSIFKQKKLIKYYSSITEQIFCNIEMLVEKKNSCFHKQLRILKN